MTTLERVPNVAPTSPKGSVLVAILEANADRRPKLVREKLRRMRADPFAFFRGTNHLFARSWNTLRPRDVGPEFLICGDLHLENFGAYRDDAGEFLYDINDFDEAVVAPASLDLVRCSTSIMIAGELWKLTPLQATGMVLAFLDEYRSAVTSQSQTRAIDAAAPRIAKGPIWDLLGKTAMGDQETLLDRNTERRKNGTRRIIRDKKRQPPLAAGRAAEVVLALENYGKAKGDPEFYEPIDVTRRTAGIGSLGVERYLALVSGGGSAETYQLLDIKDARPPAFLPCTRRAQFEGSEAARVVHAQRTLQAVPSAGLDTIPIAGNDFRIREMIPDENRSSIDNYQRKPSRLREAVETVGRLTGLSHLRGATAEPEPGVVEALVHWSRGPALDSVLASAVRYTERNRLDYKQFRAELRAPEALPEPLQRKFRQ